MGGLGKSLGQISVFSMAALAYGLGVFDEPDIAKVPAALSVIAMVIISAAHS